MLSGLEAINQKIDREISHLTGGPMRPNGVRVLVAMSGGVDSSVAAAVLQARGFEVIGVTMHLWDYSQNEKSSCDPSAKFDTCCSHEDVADARQVAEKLGIPFYVLDYEDDFKRDVVDYFTTNYLRGLTPNPCVACNTFLKFDRLMDRAKRLGCDYVCTGHYARVVKNESGGYSLLKGADSSKDQSYFLYSMTQERLSKTLFPLGPLLKSEVRLLAQEFGLVTAAKKESMEICFIPGNDYSKFIAERASNSDIIKGEVFHEDGRKLADHDGIHAFTIGQRKGLGVAAGEPVYVTHINWETGRVLVGPKKSLLKTSFDLQKFQRVRNFSVDLPLTVKIRYRTNPAPGVLRMIEDEKYRFQFLEPQYSVTPGQVAVFYNGDEVVGGGFIARAEQPCI